jgi:PleD family two-component response regulator
MSPTPDRPTALLAVLTSWLPEVLTGADYDVHSSSSGLRALEIARDHAPDVVVIAPVLDDMSGTDLCRLLRTDPALARQVPILILLDGLPSPELRVAALRVGAWGFLSPESGREEVLLTVAAHVKAKRTITEVVEEGLLDALADFCSRPGLARRARELAALMSRVRGAFACVVLELEGRSLHHLGALVARTVRLSDVVGDLGSSRMAVLAPGTDAAGVIRLAERLRDVVIEAVRRGGLTDEALEFRVGFDVVTNAKYSPVEPFGMLSRAADATHNGEPDGRLPWVRRAIPGSEAGAGVHLTTSGTPTAPLQRNLSTEPHHETR